ncbi:efflux RND transporter periplasmic adaptor subunit [Paenibacillus sp. S-12]|uniref:efflux RND transporter periplasmic adaptor subunit n=1 Tax=Paenibacillus sp. S-12 TaxID=3031371 RepID=UPI0025A12A61|nr:efflux RND transporter periplasmic adaptor subunit [Paenibacillus sp. S-12]
MELQRSEQSAIGRKRNIRLVFGLFIGLLVGFTLFSNTLATMSLPKVVLAMPSRGQLVHTFSGSGVVKWKAETALSNNSGWRVEKVLVKEGEPVKKGQTLVIYNKEAAEQQILDEQASLKKLKLSQEELKRNFIEASQKADEEAIAAAKNALGISEVDLEVQERRIQKLQHDLKANGMLIAPFDGVVTKVGATEGLPSGGAPDVVISNKSFGFEFEFLAPATMAASLEAGESVKVRVEGSQALQVEGRIEHIQNAVSSYQTGAPDGKRTNAEVSMKLVRITFKNQDIKGGEKAQLELTKVTDDALLVPNKAIRDDGGQKYVFGIEEKNGPLGNAFYIRKLPVTVIDSNESVSAVTEGLFEEGKIVTESSEPLQAGDKIRL